MKKNIASLLLFFTTLQLFVTAQTTGFHFTAPLDTIANSGFYNIVIAPAISAHVRTDYSDLRIVNDSGKWVPHLMRWPNTEFSVDAVMLDLPILKNEGNKNISEIIVKSNTVKLSTLILFLKNTEAERYCTVTGGDDLKNWFGITDSIMIQPVKSDKGNDLSEFKIKFKPNNYKFYRLIIHNNGRAPFNITGVASDDRIEGPGVPIYHQAFENPAPAIFQKDSARQTFIKVTQAGNFHFDKLYIKVSGVQYFNRVMNLYIPDAADHSFGNPGKLVQSFNITNNSDQNYRLSVIQNASVFYIIIRNEDNLPLKIDSVKTLNDYTVCTAYFEKGKHYQLLMNNAAAIQPNYDLQQFNISNKQSLTALAIGNIQNIAQPSVIAVATNRKWMIWLAIIGAGVVLTFFTYKLVKDMNKTTA